MLRKLLALRNACTPTAVEFLSSALQTAQWIAGQVELVGEMGTEGEIASMKTSPVNLSSL